MPQSEIIFSVQEWISSDSCDNHAPILDTATEVSPHARATGLPNHLNTGR